jgi:hypothetical protein
VTGVVATAVAATTSASSARRSMILPFPSSHPEDANDAGSWHARFGEAGQHSPPRLPKSSRIATCITSCSKYQSV